MSLIHGPTKAPTPKPPKPDTISQVKGMVGPSLIRQAEKLIGVRFDPAPAYLFYVSISGLLVALFTGCEGVRVTRAVEEVREGGLNDYAHSLPGHVTAGRISLKRGLSISRELWDWFTEGLYDFKVKRVSMSIVQGAPGMSAMGVIGKEGAGVVKMWNIEGAFPVSWSLSNLDVNNTNQVAIETVEIAFKSISLSRVVGIPMNPASVV